MLPCVVRRDSPSRGLLASLRALLNESRFKTAIGPSVQRLALRQQTTGNEAQAWTDGGISTVVDGEPADGAGASSLAASGADDPTVPTSESSDLDDDIAAQGPNPSPVLVTDPLHNSTARSLPDEPPSKVARLHGHR